MAAAYMYMNKSYYEYFIYVTNLNSIYLEDVSNNHIFAYR